MALLVWLFSRFSKTAYGLGFAYADDFHRLLLTLPTLRNFFTLKQARRVPFMLIPLRSYLGSVLALMVTFNFMWAILGVTMFEDVYPSIAEALDTSVVRVSSFQTVASSMLALMQVLIGEGWQDLMFAAMNGKHSWCKRSSWTDRTIGPAPRACLGRSPAHPWLSLPVYCSRARAPNPDWSLYFMVYVLVQTLLLTNLSARLLRTLSLAAHKCAPHQCVHKTSLSPHLLSYHAPLMCSQACWRGAGFGGWVQSRRGTLTASQRPLW